VIEGEAFEVGAAAAPRRGWPSRGSVAAGRSQRPRSGCGGAGRRSAGGWTLACSARDLAGQVPLEPHIAVGGPIRCGSRLTGSTMNSAPQGHPPPGWGRGYL